MESFNKAINIESEEVLYDKEMVFDSLVREEIYTAFIDDLEEAGFEEEEVNNFLEGLNKFDSTSIKGILAMPKELRGRNFPKYKQMIEEGKTSIEEIVKRLNQIAKENGYTLGYHASKMDIPRSKNGSWDIKGTELDDRDDKFMSYYSLDYKDIYRVNRGNKLYVVRAQIGEKTPHRVDNSNNWGRASSLSIVHKIDLSKIDEMIEDKLAEIKEQQERQKDAA